MAKTGKTISSPLSAEGKTATLRQVASIAGVSEMTVSRVLRGHGAFSEKSHAKVQEAVRKTGYVPNRLAGSLASARSTQIAVIVPTIGNIVFTEVLAGISEKLAASGLHAILGVSDYDLAREREMVELLLSWRPRAVIIAGLEHAPATVRQLKNAGIPVVQIMDIDGPVIDLAVGFSQKQAGAAVAAHFVSRGYKSIAYAGTDLSLDTRAAKRLEGFVTELEKWGLRLAADRRTPLPTSLESGAQALKELLVETTGVDAVYFSNDDMAVGALLYCQREGIPVPQRVAMAGFNGLGIGQALPVRLTSVRSPRVETGIRAAETVLRRIAGLETEKIVDLGFEFLPGESS